MSQPVKEDFLDEDAVIPGQQFCLLSFISPENVLDRKDLFFFEQFLKNYEITWKTKNLEKFLAKQVMDFNTKLDAEATRLMESDLSGAADICRQSRVRIDGVLESYQSFVKENSNEITQTTIKEAYDDYMYSNQKRLEDQFHAKNNFQTSIRGVKIRGNYETQEEATARAKKLQRNDPVHNIYVAKVGKWLAWDPKPHDVAEHEYAEDQLNDLMKSYKKNEEDRNEFYARNPDAKNSHKGARGEKEIMSVVGPTEEAGLFDQVDLALQRKMNPDANN
jgi:hypothetical protein